MDNGHLQIRGIKKTDEGMYNCEARVMARGEIDFRMIKVVVNGERCISPTFCSLPALLLREKLLLSKGGSSNGAKPGSALLLCIKYGFSPFVP